MSDPISLTQLLNAAQGGDAKAGEAAYAAIYDQLKRCARRGARGAGDQTMSPTALVNETWLRLTEHFRGEVRDREHFLALSARAMRQILVDHARRKASVKRGGDVGRDEWDEDLALRDTDVATALELDAALDELAARDPRLAQVVELHFFVGLEFIEIAQQQQRNERTVRRDWELARAFLRRATSAPGKS